MNRLQSNYNSGHGRIADPPYKHFPPLCLGLFLLFSSCNPFMSVHNSPSPLVVITFDDGNPSVYSFAFPTMRSIDTTWAATHFLPADYVGQPWNVSLAQLKEMEAAGWETGGHCVAHTNLTAVTPDSAESQIKGALGFLTANGLCHESFAYPWGNYNDTVRAITSKYFKNIRTSHDFDYLDGVNRTQLGYFAVQSHHSADDVIGRVEQARSQGSPLVIIGFHAVLPDTTSGPVGMYWAKQSVFKSFLLYLKKEGYTVLTMKAAMRRLCD